jgi:hypothetical protein
MSSNTAAEQATNKSVWTRPAFSAWLFISWPHASLVVPAVHEPGLQVLVTIYVSPRELGHNVAAAVGGWGADLLEGRHAALGITPLA